MKYNIAMVGERIRREPWGEAESWKDKGKVWKKLQKGGITSFMERLHGFDAGVTKTIVDTWHNGKVKIDGVTHHIIEGLIAEVTGFSLEGMNFYRDKKMSANVVNDFVKNDKEKRKLIKIDSYYNIELYKIVKGLGLMKYNLAMVGERIRREPWGEAESWKAKGRFGKNSRRAA